MRVVVLKETKTIDVNCGTGSNITVGSREGKVYRITPRREQRRERVWLPDSTGSISNTWPTPIG